MPQIPSKYIILLNALFLIVACYLVFYIHSSQTRLEPFSESYIAAQFKKVDSETSLDKLRIVTMKSVEAAFGVQQAITHATKAIYYMSFLLFISAVVNLFNPLSALLAKRKPNHTLERDGSHGGVSR